MRQPTYKLPYRTKMIVSAAKTKGAREIFYIDHDPKKDSFPVHVEYAATGCPNWFEWAHVELAEHPGIDLWEEKDFEDSATISAKEVANGPIAVSIPTGPYPDNNPKTALGVSKCPLHLVPPIVEAQMAMAWKDGAAKYGPFNWRKEKISSSVYYAAAKRHMAAWYDGEDNAEDSGVHHLAHAMACMGMILDGQTMGKLNDDRPPPGGVAKFLKECIVN